MPAVSRRPEPIGPATTGTLPILIIQPTVPQYRVWLMQGLLARYGDKLTIVAGHTDTEGASTAANLPAGVRIAGRVRRLFGGALWQTGLPLTLLLRRHRTVVIWGNLHLLNLYLWLPLLWLRGSRVFFWTQLRLVPGRKTLSQGFRLALLRRLTGVLLYTRHEAERAASEFGLTNTVGLNNTIDTQTVFRELGGRDGWQRAVAGRSAGTDGKPLVILFVGRLTGKAKVDLLIDSFAQLITAGRNARLSIVGDGPQKAECQKRASRLGIDGKIDWLPASFRNADLQPLFCAADIFVYPGNVGLSLLHSFAYGLPALIHDNRAAHMPEADALQPMVNGGLFREDDAASLAEQILALTASPQRHRLMQQAAFDTAHEVWSSDAMLAQYVHAIQSDTA